jgi:hypothetical protein
VICAPFLYTALLFAWFRHSPFNFDLCPLRLHILASALLHPLPLFIGRFRHGLTDLLCRPAEALALECCTPALPGKFPVGRDGSALEAAGEHKVGEEEKEAEDDEEAGEDLDDREGDV